MNGVLMLSMESGMLLFSQEMKPSFGLSTPCDPYQQSGFLYALYSAASAQFGSQSQRQRQRQNDNSISTAPECGCHGHVLSPLQWYTQDQVVWYFHEVCQSLPQPQPQTEHGSNSGGGGGFRRVLTALSAPETLSPASALAVTAVLSQVSCAVELLSLCVVFVWRLVLFVCSYVQSYMLI